MRLHMEALAKITHPDQLRANVESGVRNASAHGGVFRAKRNHKHQPGRESNRPCLKCSADRTSGLWRHLRLLQGHLLHPDLLRAKLPDGQLATNLSSLRLQRAEKTRRNPAKFQLMQNLKKISQDKSDFLLSAGAAGHIAKIYSLRRGAICSSEHLPTVQIPQRPRGATAEEPDLIPAFHLGVS